MNSSKSVGLGIHSEEITEVSHDAMWRAMIEAIREPERFMPVSDVSFKAVTGTGGKPCVQRTMTASGKTFTENIYEDEASCEIVYRKLDASGNEQPIERVVALRTHPMQVEFHCRNMKDGFRVNWEVPKTVALGAVAAYCKEAKRLDSLKPSVIGYGITSDPIRECSYDSLFVAVETCITDPSRAIAVEPGFTKVEDCDGYVMRTMKLSASGEVVQEKVTVNEEIGEVVYNKYLNNQPSNLERVLAIHTGPLRMEFYERNAADGMRVSWQAPYQMARDTFENIVKIAKQIEKNSTDVVGYGMASKPLTGMSIDTLWKAMLFSVRNPDRCGMSVENVKCTDNRGFMTRSMQLTEKKGKPTVSDNIYVRDNVNEVCYRPITNGAEQEEERVFAIRRDPLRLEMFCRHSKDEMRMNWRAPKSMVTGICDEVTMLSQLMYNDPAQFEAKFGQGLGGAAASYGF